MQEQRVTREIREQRAIQVTKVILGTKAIRALQGHLDCLISLLRQPQLRPLPRPLSLRLLP